MSRITTELEQTLRRLDPHSAAKLERLVRDALWLVQGDADQCSEPAVDALGWPDGYFERTAGSFAGEPLEAPADPPPEPAPEW